MDSCRAADGRAYLVKGFNVSAFFEVLGEVLSARRLTWWMLARQIGVSAATLSRSRHGRCPDATTLAALSAWSGLNPADFVIGPLNGNAATPLPAISGVLRSDPALAPHAVQALEAIIHLAYASFEQANWKSASDDASDSAQGQLRRPGRRIYAGSMRSRA